MKQPLKIPNHVAIILDGNGRWAKQRKKPRIYGHEQGAKRIKDIAFACSELGIKCLTIYCFSTENWKRPLAEVNFLMRLPKELLNNKVCNDFKKQNIRIHHLGEQTKIPKATLKSIQDAERETQECNGMILNFAFNYGSMAEIIAAVNKHIEQKETLISEKDFLENLYTNNYGGDVDLLIRPGGEKRLSNFLIIQNRYAELYFTKTLWPDFTKADLILAIQDYSQRDRRYGEIK